MLNTITGRNKEHYMMVNFKSMKDMMIVVRFVHQDDTLCFPLGVNVCNSGFLTIHNYKTNTFELDATQHLKKVNSNVQCIFPHDPVTKDNPQTLL